MPDRKHHWESVYSTKAEDETSWHETAPAASLRFINRRLSGKDAAIIDVGGGQSRLVDHLLASGFSDVSVLDISGHALAAARRRLGDRAARVRWIEADILEWTPARRYGVWHDRAVLHFLTEKEHRALYRRALIAATEEGACVVISTFALDGPERCSGLPVMRYSAQTLAEALGPAFRLEESAHEDHVTPSGAVQKFLFARFTRL